MKKIILNNEEWEVVTRPLNLYPDKSKVKSGLIDMEKYAMYLAGIPQKVETCTEYGEIDPTNRGVIIH